MATLQITEFSHLASDAKNRTLQAGDLDRVVTVQTVSYTAGTSAQSATLDRRTRLVRVISDGDAYITTEATATTNHTRLEADVAEYFSVQPTDPPNPVTGTKIAVA